MSQQCGNSATRRRWTAGHRHRWRAALSARHTAIRVGYIYQTIGGGCGRAHRNVRSTCIARLYTHTIVDLYRVGTRAARDRYRQVGGTAAAYRCCARQNRSRRWTVDRHYRAATQTCGGTSIRVSNGYQCVSGCRRG